MAVGPFPPVAPLRRRGASAPAHKGQSDFERASKQLAGYLAKRLRGVKSKQGLADRVEAMLDDDTFARFYARVTGLLTVDLLRQSGMVEAQDIFDKSVLSLAPDRFRLALRMQNMCTAVALSFAAKQVAQGRVFEVQCPPLTSFLADHRLTLENRRALLGIAKAHVCFLALLSSKVWKPTQERARDLLDWWTDGLTEYLRFVAGRPEVSLPPDLMPLDPVDLEKAAERHLAAEAGYASLLAEARASGLGVYPAPTPEK